MRAQTTAREGYNIHSHHGGSVHTAVSVLTFVLSAMTVRVDPPALALGKNASAVVDIHVSDGQSGKTPPKDALEAGASVGNVTELRELGGGRYSFRYAPPETRRPAIAIIWVRRTGSGELGWVSLPLTGHASLTLATKPRSQVTLTVGDREFGPVVADAGGNAQVEVALPPGITSARAKSVDAAGNVTTREVALNPPPYPRTLLLDADARARVIAGESVSVRAVAIDTTGKPIQQPPHFSARRGTIEAVTAEAAGIWRATYVAPVKVDDGTDELRVSPKDAAAFGTQAKVAIEAGPPARIALELTPPTARAGAGPVTVLARLFDAHDNPTPPTVPLRFSSDFGAARVDDGARALVTVPGAFAGRRRATLSAEHGAIRAQAHLPLVAADPRTVVLTLRQRAVHAGEDAEAEVLVRDAFGNPVEGANVSGAVDVGSATWRPRGQGRVAVSIRIPKTTSAVQCLVRAHVAGAPEAQATLLVLPPRRLYASAGVHVGAFMNPAPSTGLMAVRQGSMGAFGNVEVAAQPWGLWELLLNGGYASVRSSSTHPDPSVGDAILLKKVSTLGLAAGGRLNVPLTRTLGMHATALVGGTLVSTLVELANEPTLGVRQTGRAWSARAAGAMGLNVRAGRGRVVFEVGAQWTPLAGDLKGFVGGPTASVGYLFGLR